MRSRFFWGTLSFITITALSSAAVYAQTATPSGPQFLMTWQATGSYAPSAYIGKVLPNQESQIAASLELISQAGRPIDLSGQTIYWYLNDNLLGGGAGVQKITFHPFGSAPNILSLKVELPDYPGGILIHTIEIPVVQPQAIIEAPYPQDQFSASPILAQAIPYFFNATSTSPLSFTWSVNGQVVTDAENPQTLQVSLPQSTPSGFSVGVMLTIKDADDSATASANSNLVYQK